MRKESVGAAGYRFETPIAKRQAGVELSSHFSFSFVHNRSRGSCHFGSDLLTVEHPAYRLAMRQLETPLEGSPGLRDFPGRTQLRAKTFVWDRFGTLRGGGRGLARVGGQGFGDLLCSRALQRQEDRSAQAELKAPRGRWAAT